MSDNDTGFKMRRRPRRVSRPDPSSLLARGGFGAVLDSVLGSSLVEVGTEDISGLRPLSLEDSLRLALHRRGVDFVSFRREGPRRGVLLFQLGEVYWVVKKEADADAPLDREELDDWLYDALLSTVETTQNA